MDDEAKDMSRSIDFALGALDAFVPGGAVLAALIERFPAVQRHQAQVMIDQLVDALGETEHGLVARMESDPRVQRLIWEASDAAARADTRAKIGALASVVHRGLIDDAAYDESRYLVGVLAELQVIDVHALMAAEPTPVGFDRGVDLAEALGVSPGVAQSLAARLIRLGLVGTTGMSFTSVFSKVCLADLGLEVLRELRQTGDGDPRV